MKIFTDFIKNFVTRGIFATCLLSAAIATFGQGNSPDRGYRAGNSHSISDIENVNLTNGNLMMNMPLASVAGGRGTTPGYTVRLQYDGKLWNSKQTFEVGNPSINGPTTYLRSILRVAQEGGWHLNEQGFVLRVINRLDLEAEPQCKAGNEYEYGRKAYAYKVEMQMPDSSVKSFRPYGSGAAFTDINADGYFSIDQNGTRHMSILSTLGPSEDPTVGCQDSTQSITTAGMTYYSNDNSGVRLFVPYGAANNDKWKLYFPDGTLVENYPADDATATQRITDRNGNKLAFRGATVNGLTGTKIENEVGQFVFVSQFDATSDTRKIIQSGFGGTPLETTVHWNDYYVYRRYRTSSATNAPQAFKFEEVGWTLSMVDKITLPSQASGLEYNFDYNDDVDPTSGYTLGWGEMKSVTLPSGAIANYAYTFEAPGFTPLSVSSVLEREVQRRDLTYQSQYDGGSVPVTETTRYNSISTSGSVLTPDGGSHGETNNLSSQFHGYTRRITNPDGSVTEKIWAKNEAPGVAGYPVNAYVKTEFTSIPDAGGSLVLTLTKDFDYDKNGNILEIREYDWVPYNNIPRQYGTASGLPGGLTLKRKTVNTYYNPTPIATDATTDSPNHYAKPTAPKFLNLVKSTEIQDGSGTTVSRSEFVYDDFLTTGTVTNGNLTKALTWDNTKQASLPAADANGFKLSDSNSVTATTAYNAYGSPVLITDAKGVQTKITYDSSNLYPVQTETAYNTAVERTSTATYDFYTGLVTSATDIDNNITSATEYDALGRPTKAAAAIGTTQEIWTQTVYDDINRRVISKADLFAKGDAKKVATQFYDQLGRVRLSKTLEDSTIQSATNETDGVKVQTRYRFDNPTDPANSNGTYTLTSNPYRAAASGAATNEQTMGWTLGYTTKTGRHSEVETFSGAGLPAAFGGTNTTTTGKVQTDADTDRTLVTDQTGKQRISQTNTLGQLVNVWEITAADSATSAVTFNQTTAAGYLTSYEYDTLNNLKKVIQGTQTNRTFSYSSLSRLVSATNPESGTISYSYDNNGNLTAKTDARSISTAYTYDELNRVKTRNYSDNATPNVAYTYDNKGRLTKVSSSVSETEYTAFDILGRVLSHKQTTNGVSYTTGYVYNLSGALTEETYPSGRVVKNVLNSNGDLSIVQSKKNSNMGYWNYADSFTYTAAGAVSSMQLGNGKWESTTFNSRLQPTQIALGTTQGATDKLKLDFSYGTTQNNGNVQSQTITTPTVGTTAGFTATQAYTYDSLNRLKSAEETIPNQTGWKQTFQYDRYGNRTFDEANTTASANFPKNCGGAVCSNDIPIVNPTIDITKNRLVGYTYDASGNTTKDAQSRKFTFDAENKQTKVETVDANNNVIATVGEYSYDGDGKRVKKVAGNETTIFVYNAAGQLVAEYATQTAQTPQVGYLTSDHLGSPRINTDQNGAVQSRHDYQPFGEEIARGSYGADDVRKQFTGYERDNESDLDFAQNRYYNKNHGRFTSVDPALSSGMPEQAQSWNRYSYTLNNPLKFIDPTGLVWGYKDLEDGKRQFQWFDGDEVGEGFTAYTGTWWVGADTAYHFDSNSANWYEVKKTDFFSDDEWRGLQLSTNNDIQNELSEYQQERLASGLIYEIKNRPAVKQMLQLLEIAENVSAALEARSALTPTERVPASKATKKLIGDIAENGIQEPLKYVEEGGVKYVVNGNHRLLAAHALDIQQIPTQRVELPYRGFKTANDLVEVPKRDFLRPLQWLKK